MTAALVTGGSRGVGAAVVTKLANLGLSVGLNYRNKTKRAQEVAQRLQGPNVRVVPLRANVTADDERRRMLRSFSHELGDIDVLVLNASGGMEADRPNGYATLLNRDAQVAMVTDALPLMPSGARVIFVTSHQAHFVRSRSVPDIYREVAESKRAGEDSLTSMRPMLREKGIDLRIISGDMIEDTITAKLLERSRPGTISTRRESAGGHLVTVNEFAESIVRLALAEHHDGSVVFVGGKDYLSYSQGMN